MIRGLRVLVTGLLLTLAACGHKKSGEVEPFPEPPVRLEVTNKYALPIDVYAVAAGVNRRLGTVHPGMASHFIIPQAAMSGGVTELEAHPADGSRVFRSGKLLLAPGDVVDLIVEARLFNSRATIRP